jgi:hypothetical protein
VRDTLLHRAGFANPLPLRWTHPLEAHDRFDEPAFVRGIVDCLPPPRPQRRRSAYSNLGYMMLGLVLGLHGGLSPKVRAQLTEGSVRGEPWLAHAGGGLGYYAELRLYPRQGAVSALLTNRPGFRDSHQLDHIDQPWIGMT